MSKLNSSKKIKLNNQATLHSFFHSASQKHNSDSVSSVSSVNDRNGVGQSSAGSDKSVGLQASDLNINMEHVSVNLELDIGCYINDHSIPDRLKYQLLCNPWAPDSKYEFPVQHSNGHNRKFQLKWMKDFAWLTYSAKDNGAYCRFCVLFGRSEGVGVTKILELFQ